MRVLISTDISHHWTPLSIFCIYFGEFIQDGESIDPLTNANSEPADPHQIHIDFLINLEYVMNDFLKMKVKSYKYK